MAQLSRMSLLVPVFTAAQLRVASTLSVPKVRARASGSARMSPTIQAAPSSTARVNAGRTGRSARSSGATGLWRPPLASAR